MNDAELMKQLSQIGGNMFEPMSNEEFRRLTEGISSTRLARMLHRNPGYINRYRCTRAVPREIAIKVRRLAEFMRVMEEEE